MRAAWFTDAVVLRTLMFSARTRTLAFNAIYSFRASRYDAAYLVWCSLFKFATSSRRRAHGLPWTTGLSMPVSTRPLSCFPTQISSQVCYDIPSPLLALFYLGAFLTRIPVFFIVFYFFSGDIGIDTWKLWSFVSTGTPLCSYFVISVTQLMLVYLCGIICLESRPSYFPAWSDSRAWFILFGFGRYFSSMEFYFSDLVHISLRLNFPSI